MYTCKQSFKYNSLHFVLTPMGFIRKTEILKKSRVEIGTSTPTASIISFNRSFNFNYKCTKINNPANKHIEKHNKQNLEKCCSICSTMSVRISTINYFAQANLLELMEDGVFSRYQPSKFS